MPRQRITDVERHIAGRLRERRRELGLSQDNIGAACGVRYQQAQRYETGRSSISAADLWKVANLLRVPMSYFFEGLTAEQIRDQRRPAPSG